MMKVKTRNEELAKIFFNIKSYKRAIAVFTFFLYFKRFYIQHDDRPSG